MDEPPEEPATRKTKTMTFSMRIEEPVYTELFRASERADRSMSNVALRIFKKALRDPDFMREVLSSDATTTDATDKTK
jgi:predicted CopG family antitoxin